MSDRVAVPKEAWSEDTARTIATPMFWCESCGFAKIPQHPDDPSPSADAACPKCGAFLTHVTPMMPVDCAPWAESERLESRVSSLQEALRQTVDLCNAMREYAPTLNLEAERTLREALALATGGENDG